MVNPLSLSFDPIIETDITDIVSTLNDNCCILEQPVLIITSNYTINK